jgi:inhibitor of KinA sporulation pathway (predicted exonuclease)
MTGIYKQVDTTPANNDMIETLKIYLDEIDRRRNTNWRSLFPWLEEQ